MSSMGSPRHSSFTRRGFLGSLGLAASGLALGLSPLASKSARAKDAAKVPLRLLVLFTPNGTILDDFFAPTRDGKVELGPILSPLAPFRDRLLLLDGFSMGVTALGPGNAHQKGMAAWLTGMPNDDGDFCGGDNCDSGPSGWASGPSLDQRVARQLGAATPFSSLELGVRIEGANNRHRMSFTGPEQPVAPDADPHNVFRRLFGQSPGELDSKVCTVDRVAQLYRGVSQRVGKDDQLRIEAHVEAVQQLEQRLVALGRAGKCEAQPREPADVDAMNEANYPTLTGLQTELMTAAFRCDLTRVASIMWSGATAKVLPVWLDGKSYPDFPFDGPISTNFHAYTHEPYVDVKDPTQLSVRERLRTIYRWYAQSVANVLKSLDSVKESDGSTLLDNTLVLWGSELASPDTHSFDRMPFVVAGGTKVLKTGRYVNARGEQHTALLATLGHLLGLPDAKFGHPDFARAPLHSLIR